MKPGRRKISGKMAAWVEVSLSRGVEALARAGKRRVAVNGSNGASTTGKEVTSKVPGAVLWGASSLGMSQHVQPQMSISYLPF